MAEVLEDFKFDNPKMGRPIIYDKWLDGQIWKINWRKETKASSQRVASGAAHTAARRLGLKVKTRKVGKDYMVIQAWTPTD